jgi:hypothetical protein
MGFERVTSPDDWVPREVTIALQDPQSPYLALNNVDIEVMGSPGPVGTIRIKLDKNPKTGEYELVVIVAPGNVSRVTVEIDEAVKEAEKVMNYQDLVGEEKPADKSGQINLIRYQVVHEEQTPRDTEVSYTRHVEGN